MAGTEAPLRTLAPADWSRLLAATARSVAAHAPGLDRLDAAPVGDGDCGGNLAAAAAALASAVEGHVRSFGELATAVAAVGAPTYGRSAALLHDLVVAATHAARNQDRLDATALAVALEAAAEVLHERVPAPPAASFVPVLDAVVTAALAAADDGATLAETVVAAADAGFDALEAGPGCRDDLAEAGVVDAGAAGLLVLVDALVAEVHGEEIELPAWDFPDPEADEPLVGTDGRYRVELRLEVEASASAELATVWSTLGAGVRTWQVEDGWRASVRTDDIGAVIEAALGLGRPRDLRVEDLRG